MNFSTQRSYGNHLDLGMQASQLISRNTNTNDSTRLENISENLNRFLSAHSRKKITQNSRKFRLSEYFNQDLRAKSYSTHHYLCGPLNTNRVTRKTISGNFDNDSTTQSLSVADLYNNSTNQIANTKRPWIEPRKPINTHDRKDEENRSETKTDSSFNFKPRLDEHFSNDKDDPAIDNNNKPVSNDGPVQVPDPVHLDLRDSCALYEQCPSPDYDYEKNTSTSDDENIEPDTSRYNFFIGTTGKVPEYDVNKDSRNCRNDKQVIKTVRRKRRPREEVFEPLITSSQD
ncbi:uncharacterized protein LOC135842874 [Planococcus citri]|uniref:uncharacterized protein LOC135842874 n=1 Tax=Planococcus citri TaxID=170843 RepID=UPI0031F7D0B0